MATSSKEKVKATINNIDPHILSDLRFQCYWALSQLENKQKQDRFSAKELADYLTEEIRIKTSRQAVEYSLGIDKKAVDRKNGKYKIMQHGTEELLFNNCTILYFEPGKPFTGKKYAAESIFSKLKGKTRICDAYCGAGLLDFIFKNINRKNSVRILTQKIIDRPTGSFLRTFNDLKSEGFNVQIKVYTSSILHDRFIIDNQNTWFSGNSFNDLGKKESLIVLLGKDIRQSLLTTFNTRWRKINREYS